MTTAHGIHGGHGPIDDRSRVEGDRPSRSVALGLLLVAPMLLATAISVGWPTVDAIVTATIGSSTPFGEQGPADWGLVVGAAGGLALAGFGITLPSLLAGVLVAIPIAQALAVGALAARIGVAVLLVASMPIAAATWWATGVGGLGPSGALGTFAAAALPTIAGVAAIALVPVVRAGLRLRHVLLVVAGVGGAAVALALQTFVTSIFATGPASTFASTSYERTFRLLDVADGAAYDTVVLLVLGGAGIAGVALVAALRPAIVVHHVPAARPLAATIGALVAGVLALGVVAMPVALAATIGQEGLAVDVLASAAAGSWLPALLGALTAAVLAAVAAVGIGWFRPLGRHSLWLLLPFAPALLVTAAPLTASTSLRRVAVLGDALPLLPSVVVSVPLLVALTLVAAGMRRTGALQVRTLLWASLVGVAILAAAQAQAPLPALALSTSAEDSLQLAMLSVLGVGGGAGSLGAIGVAALAATLPVALVLAPVVVLGLGALRGATLVDEDAPLPTAHAEPGQVPPPTWQQQSPQPPRQGQQPWQPPAPQSPTQQPQP